MISLVAKPADNGNSIIQMIPKATNVIVNDDSFGLEINLFRERSPPDLDSVR